MIGSQQAFLFEKKNIIEMFQYLHDIVPYYQALHNIEYYSLKQAHVEADIKNIVSIEVLTKND